MQRSVIIQTYSRWSRVPSDLKTKTQWNRDGRKLREDVVPVAQVHIHGAGTYDLFDKKATTKKDSAKSAKAKIASRKGNATKRKNLEQLLVVNPIRIIRELPAAFAELQQIASAHAVHRYGGGASTPGMNGVIATVRHEFSNYESVLALIHGKCGTT